MPLLHAALFFVAQFALVFLMGLQSRSVNSGMFLAAAMTSVMIAAAQVTTVRAIVWSGPWEAFLIAATAGPAGIVSSMFVHRKFFKRVEQ